MSILHRYLLRQIIATLAMTAAVFSLVLLLGNVLREILPLLINQKASLGIIVQTFGLLIPFVLVFALPMGMLTATLLVFGRFSADQELTAARASGISLLSLITPILILSLVLCAFSAVVNMEIAPLCRVAYLNLRFDLRAALANAPLPEKRYLNFPGNPEYTVYVERNRKQILEDVLLFQTKDETNTEMKVNAPRGRIEVDKPNQRLILHLYDAQIVYISSDMLPMTSKECQFILNLQDANKGTNKPAISDMTFDQLQDELQNVERLISSPLLMDKSSATNQPSQKRLAAQKKRMDPTEPLRIQIHRRVALSFACFSFTLIGIPLGIRAHRRETNVGVAITLVLVAVYYGLVVVAQSLSAHAEFAPHLLIWLPNFVFQAVGIVLLRRANRGL